ncbi:unnamed protein product [Adineta ricciae]|uniref:Uncharacterized protein n=1 Tax=Adineta ricciae TaxID=249248 RepID=A0A815I826_ADIRI|nr:unnamed protein product [Adineta ricciae]
MTSILIYSIFLAVILSNFVHSSYPGDGCCVTWSGDGSCCMDSFFQCCVDAAPYVDYYSVNNFYGVGGYYSAGGWRGAGWYRGGGDWNRGGGRFHHGGGGFHHGGGGFHHGGGGFHHGGGGGGRRG